MAKRIIPYPECARCQKLTRKLYYWKPAHQKIPMGICRTCYKSRNCQTETVGQMCMAFAEPQIIGLPAIHVEKMAFLRAKLPPGKSALQERVIKQKQIESKRPKRYSDRNSNPKSRAPHPLEYRCSKCSHPLALGEDKVCSKCRSLSKTLIKRDIELMEYQLMLESQNGLCAICNSPPKANLRLAVDHDHQTGRVRGLLCNRCNLALGAFHDSSVYLLRAISYLERSNPPYDPSSDDSP